MKDRIRQIMESQHMSQQVFADFIGTTPATLSGIFNDRTRPTLSIVELIKKKIPDISTDWLMFGTGQMYQQSPTPPVDVKPAEIPTGGSAQFMESMIDFGQSVSPTPHFPSSQATSYNSVRTTPLKNGYEELKIVDKPKRHVVEIRVYYDDLTYETFIPSKK